MTELISQIDFSVLNFIKEHFTCAFLDAAMPFFTSLGNFGAVWIALTLLLFLFKKHRKTAASMAVSLILTVVVCNLLIKPLVARARPFSVNTAAQLLIAAPGDFSFPSSHTAASFAASCALLKGSKRLGAFALVLAVIISFSRMYLYVHYPSDVIAGAVIGALLAAAAGKLIDIFSKRTPKKKRVRKTK